MKTFLYVALGGAIGASARYAVGIAVLHFGGGHFPWGTMIVNILGSLMLGVLAGAMAFAWSPSPELRAFVVVGLLGGFTTFSAFSMDVVLLAERGRLDLAAAYMAATVFVSVAAMFAGLRVMRLALT